MKIVVTIFAVAFILAGLGMITVCAKYAIDTGDIEGGNFNAYAGYYRNEQTGEIEFIDWPTGERPWLTWIPSWVMGIGLVVVGGGFWQVRRIWSGGQD